MILWLTFVLSLVWFAVFKLKRRRMYQLAELIPSTKNHLPLIGVAHKMVGSTQDLMNQLQKYSTESIENDGLVKMWLGPILSLIQTDAVDVEYVLKNYLEKDDVHRLFRSIIGNATVYAPVSIWRRRRKMLTPTFYPKVLETFVAIFSEHSEILAKNMRKYEGNGRFKLWPVLSLCTLDSICETAMDVKLYAQDNLESPFINALANAMRIISERIFYLWLRPDWLFKRFPISREFEKCKNLLCEFTDEVISKKRADMETLEKSCLDVEQHEHDKKPSFLDLLITQSKTGSSLTNLELREEVVALAVAGSDTTAVTMGNTLKMLGKYPLIQERVYQELRDVFGDSDRPLVKEDLPKLKYLEQVIKETLRLFPPVAIITRKVVEEITLPSGRILPANVASLISIWGVHRNPKYWGPDADHFDPDRFLPERFKGLPCSFIPFSFGPRNCIGYQYALMAVKTLLSTILRKYKIIDHPENGPAPKMDMKFEIMMKAVDEYEMALEPRK